MDITFRFEYLTPRVRLTPNDLQGTPFERPTTLHFICSPARAAVILSEVKAVDEWSPIIIYEPIPVSASDSTTVYCSGTESQKQVQMHTRGAASVD